MRQERRGNLMRCRIRALAATPAFALAYLAAGCSSTQTSLTAPTADKCQVTPFDFDRLTLTIDASVATLYGNVG